MTLFVVHGNLLLAGNGLGEPGFLSAKVISLISQETLKIHIKKQMSFDKAKAMRNAERFLAQGKIRAAINEYQRVVETDKNDYSTLNMLGDLLAKASEPDEAVACFTQVAEHYSKQGFAQKAIAIYNKISRLKPDSIEVSAKLAQLYQSKGSVAEARVHYATLAEQYSRSGKKAEALNIWKQIANLDSGNTDIYLKIADAYWQENQKDEAASAYVEAGKRHNTKKQFESAVTAFSRALEIKPDEITALKGFVESQTNLGYADEAAKTLESSIARQPHNRELVFMLIDCYIDMNNLLEAEKTVTKLVEQEPSNFPKLLDLVDSYLKNSDLESAARILSIASEHLLVGGKAQTLENLLNEILTRNPEQLDAIRLQVRLYTWQRDESAIKSSFEKLAEIAKINNSVEDERYALEQLVMISPQNAYFAQRLQELNLANGYSQGYYEKPQTKTSADVPTFESYSGLVQEDEAKFQTDAVVAEYGSALNYSNGNGNGHSNGFHFAGEETAPQPIEADSIVVEDSLEHIENHELSEFDRHNLQKELEGIDFYITEGFLDLAERGLNELVERYGNQPEINKLRERLKGDHNPVETEESESSGEETETPTTEENLGSEVEYSDDFSGDDQFTIQTQDIHKTTDSSLAEEQSPVKDPSDTDNNDEDFVDSIEEFEKTLAENSSVNYGTHTSANPFEEFQSEVNAVENQMAENSDFETRYQMGIAYKEMGLIEDAIREFQEAIRLVSVDDGTRRFFWCCNLLGHCFIEKRMPNIALMWFKRGLEAKYLSSEESQGLRYEIANAYEMGGDKQMAIHFFEEIYAVNVSFRDVGNRLEKLMTA